MTTEQWQRTVLVQCVQWVKDEDVIPENAARVLHGAGIGAHLSSDVLVTTLADAAGEQADMERYQSGDGEAYADRHAARAGHALRVADRRAYADELAADHEAAYEWCLSHVLGAGWALAATA